jgi:probable addiction module antidote protein
MAGPDMTNAATSNKVTFRRFDASEHLTDEIAIAAYLNAAAEENDPALMALALGDIARARNMSQLARDAGMSREGLYKALSEDGNPSLATVMKVASALGFQLAFQPVERTS